MVLWTSAEIILLWLQRACAGDHPVAVKRSVILVDVYEANAKLIISTTTTEAWISDAAPTSLINEPEHHRASNVWGIFETM